MKILLPLAMAALLTACNPSTSTDSTDTQTTKTTTTVTTSSSGAASGAAAAPVMPVVAPSTLTQANLDRIQNDMSQAEVETILGAPTNSSSQPIPIVGGTQTTYTYQNGNAAVTVVFKNNQVKEKSGTFNP